ncbi:helix-turn-helix transcriptional regulator [Eggerthella guodeyinii]|nr:helix-turn-helix domain-containing protein [Eggerthella guodeyinii]
MRRSLFDRSFVLVALGFSLFLSWPYCTFSMTSLLGSSVHGDSLNNYCWIASLLFVSITLFVLAALRTRTAALLDKTAVKVTNAVVLAAANVVIMVGGTVPGAYGVALVLAACVATGVATGFLHVLWGLRIMAIGVGRVPALVPIAYTCSFAEVLLTVLLPVEIRPLFVIGGIVVAGILLCIRPRSGGEDAVLVEREAPSQVPATKVLTMRDFAVVFFCFVCSSFVDSLSRPSRMVDIAEFPVTLLIAAAFAAMVAVALMKRSRGLTFDLVTRLVTPVLLVGLLFSIWPSDALPSVAYIMVFSVTQMTVIFIWIAGITHGVQSAADMVRVLGVPLGVNYAGSVAGTAIGLLLGLANPAMVAFSLAVLLGSAVVVFSNREQPQSPIIAREYVDARSATFDRLSSRYGLSKREGEIFALFASGRNSAYICDICFISRNTVDTHLKHIYDKTGVRSKQGLIDLVEEEERSLVGEGGRAQ